MTADDADMIHLYWRPGCGFCMGLERQLAGTDLPIERHNIWDDPDAAAYVRSVAGGNEVVPTVKIGEIALVNPTGDQVVRAWSER